MMRWGHLGYKTYQMTGYFFFGLLEGKITGVDSWSRLKHLDFYRAMELGRELFELWGYVVWWLCMLFKQKTVVSYFNRYRRCDELIWVKTNQLQRLIRTGRTGHWLNHGKEHCLVWRPWILFESLRVMLSQVGSDWHCLF